MRYLLATGNRLMDIFAAIYNLVVGMGGGDEHMERIRTDSELASQIADLIMGKVETVPLSPQRIMETGRTREVRLEALSRINEDQALVGIAECDTDLDVRKAAVRGIKSEGVLTSFATQVLVPNADLFTQKELMLLALRCISDKELIRQIAERGKFSDLRTQAMDRLDQTMLVEIGLHGKDERARCQAINRMTNQVALETLARRNQDELGSLKGVAQRRLDDLRKRPQRPTWGV